MWILLLLALAALLLWWNQKQRTRPRQRWERFFKFHVTPSLRQGYARPNSCIDRQADHVSGRLTLEQADRAFSAYRQNPVQLLDVDMEASLKLASDLNIYAYDAYVLECAQRYRATLLTLDAGLRAAAERVDVTTLEVSE